MTKEIVINSTKKGIDIAVLEDKVLVELHQETAKNEFQAGDMYLGQIKKIMPGLNAAFVNVGHKKDAFLHYSDLSPTIRTLNKFVWNAMDNPSIDHTLNNIKFEPETVKTGKMENVLQKRKPILVQILKEPISTKGPRLTCEISIPGRYLILTPFTKVLNISKKINSREERKRLQNLVESIKPKNFGIIVRTNAKGKKVSELHEDLTELLKKWKGIQMEMRTAVPPQKIYTELNKTNTLIRDVLNEKLSKISVNDSFLASEIKTYVKENLKLNPNIVQHHNSKRPIFDQFGVTKQIKSSFGKTVTMKSGAYLVIEHTEAMHVIDVNSGYKSSDQNNQESQAIQVNIESANEIARQLRLRDIGGLIIIDFIDMRSTDNKKVLYTKMKEAMREDNAKHTVLPLSRFGLMQITRQRAKPELKISTKETCPSCKGSGKISASILIVDEIEENLGYLFNEMNMQGLKLFVHPYVHAFFVKGIFNTIQWKWLRKYKHWVKILPNNDYAINEYNFFDSIDDIIDLGK